jgi:uncharacterized protein YxeA
MKKILVMVFALALATSAFAQKKVTADYSGIVDKYDAATKTLTIKRKDKQGEFVITDASEILNSNAKADASAIAAGQKAEVKFWLEGSKKIVQKLKISGAATK